MYIICWLPLVIFGELFGHVGDTIGLVMMFLLIAAATCLQIYNGAIKPKFNASTENWDDDDDDADDDDDDNDDDDDDDEKTARAEKNGRSPAYKAISSALWRLTVCGYLLVSFATGAWHITWMIFLIVTALDNVIKAIFDLRR
jgi:hypothetical protein